MVGGPIDEIKSRLDLIDVIQEYVSLKPSGSNWKGLCPFHNEKTPSFMVSREKQIWHCFGCHAGGDLFGFIQKIEGVEFPEALRILAKKAGVELRREDPVIQNQKTRLLDLLRMAAKYYHAVLLESSRGEVCRKYLEERRIDETTVDQFELGYSVDAWDVLLNFLIKKGFKEEEIFLSGLTVKRESGGGFYDRFRSRLIFPIRDVHGMTVGFGGRTLAGDDPNTPKYLNSPQTLVYNKSMILYALDHAKSEIRKKGEVIVVEGYLDCLSCHEAGVTNVVATAGTALTEDHVGILKRFTSTILLAFDEDTAGSEATKRAIELALVQEMNVKVLELPRGKDPDECIREDSSLFQKAVREARSYLAYSFDRVLRGIDPHTLEGKKTAAASLLPLLVKIGNPIEQHYWLKLLAQRLSIDERILAERMVASGNKRRPIEHRKASSDFYELPLNRFMKIEEEVLALLIRYPHTLPWIAEGLLGEYFADSLAERLYKLILVDYTEGELFDPLRLRKRIGSTDQNMVQFLDVLGLLAEDRFSDWGDTKIRQQLQEYLRLLKRRHILSRLQEIEQEMKVLETEKTSASQHEFKALNEAFNDLTHQLHQLE